MRKRIGEILRVTAVACVTLTAFFSFFLAGIHLFASFVALELLPFPWTIWRALVGLAFFISLTLGVIVALADGEEQSI